MYDLKHLISNYPIDIYRKMFVSNLQEALRATALAHSFMIAIKCEGVVIKFCSNYVLQMTKKLQTRFLHCYYTKCLYSFINNFITSRSRLYCK